MKMILRVSEKLRGVWRKRLILETFSAFNQMEKEYWKILKTKLLKEASSKMEPWVGKDVMKTESWTLLNVESFKTEFFMA